MNSHYLEIMEGNGPIAATSVSPSSSVHYVTCSRIRPDLIACTELNYTISLSTFSCNDVHCALRSVRVIDRIPAAVHINAEINSNFPRNQVAVT